MAKKRSCRRTEEENKQHELAVKVRKMTDKQIADLLSGKASGQQKIRKRNIQELILIKNF